MSVQLRRRRFTVDEYCAMADAGILTEDDRVELIEGEIIQMAAIGSRHAACVDRLNRVLVQRTHGQAIVRTQNPVRLSDLSEPEPDFSLLRPRDDFYAAAHPGPADVLLIIEVAHGSLGYDRDIKLPLYALAPIPEVWIVDLDAGEVGVHRDPEGNRYRLEDRARSGQTLAPTLIPTLHVPVEAILV